MRPVGIILRREEGIKGNDVGGDKNTLVDVTMYPLYNNDMTIKIFFKKYVK
jgi:hypothetical protein